jgi:hypothetical protein
MKGGLPQRLPGVVGVIFRRFFIFFGRERERIGKAEVKRYRTHFRCGNASPIFDLSAALD